jgi:hypothetical protein
MKLGVPFSSNSGKVDGMRVVQEAASVTLWPWGATSSFSSFFSFLYSCFLSSVEWD